MTRDTAYVCCQLKYYRLNHCPVSLCCTVFLTEPCLPPVWGHGGRPRGPTGSLYPTPPWTWSWVTGSGSCCHLDASALELSVSWATCRGRQSSTLGWSCRHLITDCMTAATGDTATLNGNWSTLLWAQATCSFLLCHRVQHSVIYLVLSDTVVLYWNIFATFLQSNFRWLLQTLCILELIA